MAVTSMSRHSLSPASLLLGVIVSASVLPPQANAYSLRALPATWHPHLRRVRLADGSVALERRYKPSATPPTEALAFIQQSSSSHHNRDEECPCPADEADAADKVSRSRAAETPKQLAPKLAPAQSPPAAALLQVGTMPVASQPPTSEYPVAPMTPAAGAVAASMPLAAALPPATFQAPLAAQVSGQAAATFQQQAAMEMMQVNAMRFMEVQLQSEEARLQQQIQMAEQSMQQQGFQQQVAPIMQTAPQAPPAPFMQQATWAGMPMGSYALPQMVPMNGAVPPISPMQQSQLQPLQTPQAYAAFAGPLQYPGPAPQGVSPYWR
mmetsp:Transcript_35639/g.83368  ORF Transcript_35639/g.83368 Transcript_35639/m.83368 type:complete len:323 (+) Transcript_35639:145-1113(+)